MPKMFKKDFSHLSEFITDEWQRRKRERGDLEKQWKDIDRQIAMIPDCSHKQLPDGRPDRNKAWMPELELPDQAEALEVLTGDARQMLFPDSGPWYKAHSLVTDDYLEKVDFSALIAGDQNDVPSVVDQDNVDKLVHGVLDNWHRMYPFYDNYDQINGEAFKYGVGIGRGRMVKAPVFWHSARGVMRESQKIPMLFPLSIKNVYLEDREHFAMNEGMAIRPAHILYKRIHIEDLRRSANAGSKDPNNIDGGWMPANLNGLEPDKTQHVELLEWEGDLIVPRKSTGNMFLPNVLATVAIGKGDQQIVRLRFRSEKRSSLLVHHYHREDAESPYGGSPLMKGHHIQKAAVDAMTRIMMMAALQAQPPIGYDQNDPIFASTGGPLVFPGAQWGTAEGIEVYSKIGDLNAMFAVYSGLLQQYSDVVGVNPPRLGAQTISHTTAYAKNVELTKGSARTVAYVRKVMKGPLNSWLDMAYQMGRGTLKNTPVWVDAYGGWVNVSRETLPEQVVFDVHGSGGPAEEQQISQKKIEGLMASFNIDQLRAQYKQMGIEPTVDMEAAIEQLLRESGWSDVDALLNAATTAQSGPGMPGGEASTEAAGPAALMALAQGGQM